MRFGISTAEPEERTVELAALLAALFTGPSRSRPGRAPSIRAEPGRFWLLRELEELLKLAAASGRS